MRWCLPLVWTQAAVRTITTAAAAEEYHSALAVDTEAGVWEDEVVEDWGVANDDFDEEELMDDARVRNLVQAQVDWVRDQGGFVSSKVAIGHVNDVYGLFAMEDLQEDDVIFSIPQSCLLTGEAMEEEAGGGEGWLCDTAFQLVREMRLGASSHFAPYVQYLLETQHEGQLPSHWSDAGKDLLLQVTGGTRQEDDQLVPPFGPVGWIEHEWKTECGGGTSNSPEDRLEQHAFLLVVQRGWDDVLIPLYDMMSHRNGPWLNTRSNSVHGLQQDEHVVVRASQFVPAGSQLYTSYNECSDCGNRAATYGTPEILRDYGFVEDLPQRYVFAEQDISFVLNGKEEEDVEKLELHWTSPVPNDDGIWFLEQQLARLAEVEDEFDLEQAWTPDNAVPEHEWTVIGDYLQALYRALEYAVAAAHDEADDQCLSTGECTVSSTRYDALDQAVSVDYNAATCDTTRHQDFDDYDDTEEVISPYQVISYFEHPTTHDTCFDLDNIYQICSSYRPHYHEMVVHYTARFLPNITRVIWVGGGDSMLLHEILKYPSLELVIGLELDQKVTRHSFKHFGTQPHWDNDKVQWWYGDAAKSLLMLPKEYFGSFDMVLVDLSETVMSSKVTSKGLDIMGALSLLLKPEGIFVKNELYFEQLKPIFRHTLQVHIYDFPVICSQALSLGSNALDFSKATITDHKVETMFQQLHDIDQHYSIVHDYEMNPEAQRHCKTDEEDEEPTSQEKSPGIILLLEAENSTAQLTEEIETTAVLALEKLGLYVVSSVTSRTVVGTVTVVMMREGYIVARTWPQHAYCAFDIHLWSRFEKLDSVKQSLLEAVGSRSPSSFRIVAGGMFGVSAWVQDEIGRGPRFAQECGNDESVNGWNSAVGEEVTSLLLEESLASLAKGKDTTALVICGTMSTPCLSLDTVQNTLGREGVPLYTCPSIEGGVEYQQDSAALKFTCERNILSALEASISEAAKIGVIVLDPRAEYAMAQIVYKIMSREKNRNLFVATHDLLVLVPVLEQEDMWRSVFAQKFLEVLPHPPAFYANSLFNHSDSNIALDVFSSGDGAFVEKLFGLTVAMEEGEKRASGLVRNVRGGRFGMQPDFVPTQFFEPKDYNQIGPYSQWKSQQPLGVQTVFQMELTDETATLSVDAVRERLDSTLTALNIKTSSAVQSFVDLGDGCAIIATWLAGSVVALFNGRDHVDLNLFTHQEDIPFATEFAAHFMQDVSLKVILRDEMPRGYGRVVSLLKDLSPGIVPSWALEVA